MLSASISVVLTVVPASVNFTGIPPVSARFWSNSLNELVSVRKIQMVNDDITFGIVIRTSVCHLLAPSIFAASIISSGMLCNPAI